MYNQGYSHITMDFMVYTVTMALSGNHGHTIVIILNTIVFAMAKTPIKHVDYLKY